MKEITQPGAMARDDVPAIQIYLLGRFQVARGERVVQVGDWRRRKAAALLQRLALEEHLLRDEALDFLWPDADPGAAANNLYRTLYSLRQTLDDALGEGTAEATFSFEDGVLRLSPDVWVDAHVFEELSRRRGVTKAQLEEALALYTGPLLPDAAYGAWSAAPRRTLHRLYRDACLRLANEVSGRREIERAIAYLRPFLEEDRADEDVHRHLMRLFALLGRRHDALRQYQSCMRALDEELGLPPTAETRALHEQIVRGELETVPAEGRQRQPSPPSTPSASPTPAATQEIRFCMAEDGVRVAYATSGAGPPLVKTANYLTHVEHDWHSPVWRHWLRGLSQRHTLVRYDERGCGLSDWDVTDFSMDGWVNDLEAVVDALGLERFPLLGISQGAAVSVAYAARHPEKVSHLILYGGYARGRFHRDLSADELAEAEMLIDAMRIGWGRQNPAFRQLFTTFLIPEGTEAQEDSLNELARISATPEKAAAMEEAFYQIDVTDLAPQVTAPTLVLHARQDAAVPFEEGRILASLISGARFVPLESKNHILLESERAWTRFLAEVHAFLPATREGLEPADTEP